MWGRTHRLLATTAILCAALSLGACFDGDNNDGSTPKSYTVGGTLSGLGSGLSITLLNNGANALARTTNGSFTFSTAVKKVPRMRSPSALSRRARTARSATARAPWAVPTSPT